MSSQYDHFGKVKIESHVSPPPKIQGTSALPKGNILHVANIPSKMTYEQIKKGLYNLFSIYGPIYDITIKTKENGSHFAFVDFPNICDTEKALNASKREGKTLQGQNLIVNYCEDPKKNQDRKDQKCFLCHNNGHKARNCTVRPQLIKKFKKGNPRDDCYTIKSGNFGLDSPETAEGGFNNQNEEAQSVDAAQKQSECDDFCSGDSRQTGGEQRRSSSRDKDYLRFLKLKKKLLERRLFKKCKSKKKRV